MDNYQLHQEDTREHHLVCQGPGPLSYAQALQDAFPGRKCQLA
jgi:hypothetical protein